MTKTETFVVFILAVWLALSVLYPLFNRQLGDYTLRWDIFRWLSAYQLFSDTPRRFRLFYRDRLENETTSEWKEIALTVRPKWFHAFWFPEDLPVSNIRFVVDEMVRFLETKRNSPAFEKFSERFIFRALWRFVLRQPAAGDNADTRQFKIEEIGGLLTSDSGREHFVSEFYN